MKHSLFAILLAIALFAGASTARANHVPKPVNGAWAYYCVAQSAYSGQWTWWAAYNLAYAQSMALNSCQSYFGGCFLRGCQWRYVW